MRTTLPRPIIDQFEEMRQGTDQPLVMSVVLHSFISGQPFRLRALRAALKHIAQARDTLWLTQPGDIARHYRSLEPHMSFKCTIALVLLALLPIACGSNGARPIVIASVSDVSSLDPHLLDNNHPTGSVIWSLFDSLVRRGPDGADLPRLAQSWERIDDLTWRFHLRHDVKFQDGSATDRGRRQIQLRSHEPGTVQRAAAALGADHAEGSARGRRPTLSI